MYANRAIILILCFFYLIPVYSSELKLKDRWASVIKVDQMDKAHNGELISIPMGTKQSVLALTLLNNNFAKEVDCLLYERNKESASGRILIIKSTIQLMCDKLEDKNIIFEFNNIYNFAYEIDEAILRLLIDSKNIEFELINKKLEDSSVKISTVNSKLNRSRDLSEGDICFDVSDSCEVILDKDCTRCPRSVIAVVASSCKSNVRKYCAGIPRCGDKGEPACIRGWEATGYKGRYCIPDSPIAFCKKPARVLCENKELICK